MKKIYIYDITLLEILYPDYSIVKRLVVSYINTVNKGADFICG